jgi:hypothetical protein
MLLLAAWTMTFLLPPKLSCSDGHHRTAPVHGEEKGNELED